MKKNLKGCVEPIEIGEARLLLDMNQYDRIEAAGLTTDLTHKKSAYMTAKWQFSECTRAVFATGGIDLSDIDYITFSVFSVGGAGGSFSLMLDNGAHGEGKDGYAEILPIVRDGWNSYRVAVPFMGSVGAPAGKEQVESICFDCAVGGQANREGTKLYIDNVTAWSGNAAPLYVSAPELKGAVVFSRSGGYCIADRKRISNTPDGTTVKPMEKNGVLWVPMAPVAAGIAHAAVVDTKACTLSFTYRRKKYVFSANRNTVSVNGEDIALGFYPAEVEGTLLFPCEYVREFFRLRQTFTDPMGLVVLSNRKNIYESRRDEHTILQWIADTTFMRPDGNRILEDLHRNFPNPARGRLFASFDEWMQLRRDAKTDAQLGDYTERLKALYGTKSAAFAATPVSPDADVTEKQAAAEAVIAFAALYRVTGDKAYATRTYAECEALSAGEDWASTSLSYAAELAFGVTLGYDWCRHVWTEAQKARIERAILRGAMRPLLDAYNGKGLAPRPAGTAACVIACGMTAASLALAEVYPQTSYKLLDRIVRTMEPCLLSFAPDGGCSESVAAWEKSARALILTISMLRRACGSDYGLSSAPGFAATAYFPIFAETAAGAWNYHGSDAHPVDTSTLFAFAKLTEDNTLAWLRRNQILAGKKAVHPFDILFYTPVDASLAPRLPLDSVWRRAGLAMMRAGWSDGHAFLGLHAGSNHTNGAELDAGSFVLDMGGERFIEETGGDERLPILLRRRAEGQNTFAVDPLPAPAPDQNPDAIARFTEMRSSAERAYAVADMTMVSDRLLRAKRGAMLTDGRTVAVVQDELVLDAPRTVVWSLWTRAAVKLNASGRVATLSKNDKALACRLSGIGSPARFEATAIEGTDWTCLRVTVKDKERVRIAFVCRLLGEGESAAARVYEVVPMSRWGEIENK